MPHTHAGYIMHMRKDRCIPESSRHVISSTDSPLLLSPLNRTVGFLQHPQLTRCGDSMDTAMIKLRNNIKPPAWSHMNAVWLTLISQMPPQQRQLTNPSGEAPMNEWSGWIKKTLCHRKLLMQWAVQWLALFSRLALMLAVPDGSSSLELWQFAMANWHDET